MERTEATQENTAHSKSETSLTMGARETFRELVIYGGREELVALGCAIEARLTEGWHRNREFEAMALLPPGESFFSFVRDPRGAIPAVAVVMLAEAERLSVLNIVPKGHEIGPRVYNSVLFEFYLAFVDPAVADAGLMAELSADERSLEEILESRQRRCRARHRK